MFPGNNIDWNLVIDRCCHTLFPGILEAHSVDLLDEIDAEWRLPEENDAFAVAKIFWRAAPEWGSKLEKRVPYGFAVLDAGTDENIKIFGRARLGVDSEGVY
jgi:hypothetical protein